MPTQDLAPIKAAFRRSGGPVTIQSFDEAASQTFKRGEAVYLDGSGNVAEFTASVDDGSTRFLGFAAEDAHNDSVAATHKVGVYVPDDDLVFEGNIYHGTVGSAVTAKTDVGTLLPMKQLTGTAGGIIAVDKEDTSSQIDCCRIIGFPSRPGQAVGDTYGRVLFIIEAAGRTLGQ